MDEQERQEQIQQERQIQQQSEASAQPVKTVFLRVDEESKKRYERAFQFAWIIHHQQVLEEGMFRMGILRPELHSKQYYQLQMQQEQKNNEEQRKMDNVKQEQNDNENKQNEQINNKETQQEQSDSDFDMDDDEFLECFYEGSIDDDDEEYDTDEDEVEDEQTEQIKEEEKQVEQKIDKPEQLQEHQQSIDVIQQPTPEKQEITKDKQIKIADEQQTIKKVEESKSNEEINEKQEDLQEGDITFDGQVYHNLEDKEDEQQFIKQGFIEYKQEQKIDNIGNDKQEDKQIQIVKDISETKDAPISSQSTLFYLPSLGSASFSLQSTPTQQEIDINTPYTLEQQEIQHTPLISLNTLSLQDLDITSSDSVQLQSDQPKHDNIDLQQQSPTQQTVDPGILKDESENKNEQQQQKQSYHINSPPSNIHPSIPLHIPIPSIRQHSPYQQNINTNINQSQNINVYYPNQNNKKNALFPTPPPPPLPHLLNHQTQSSYLPSLQQYSPQQQQQQQQSSLSPKSASLILDTDQHSSSLIASEPLSQETNSITSTDITQQTTSSELQQKDKQDQSPLQLKNNSSYLLTQDSNQQLSPFKVKLIHSPSPAPLRISNSPSGSQFTYTGSASRTPKQQTYTTPPPIQSIIPLSLPKPTQMINQQQINQQQSILSPKGKNQSTSLPPVNDSPSLQTKTQNQTSPTPQIITTQVNQQSNENQSPPKTSQSMNKKHKNKQQKQQQQQQQQQQQPQQQQQQQQPQQQPQQQTQQQSQQQQQLPQQKIQPPPQSPQNGQRSPQIPLMNTPQSNIRQQQSVSVVSNSNPNQNFKEPVLQQPFASAKGKPPLKNQFMYKSTVPLNSTDSSSVQSQPIVQPNITPQYAYAPAINAYQPIIQPYSMQAAQPQNMYTNQYLYSGFGFQHNSTSTQFTYRSGDKKKKP